MGAALIAVLALLQSCSPIRAISISSPQLEHLTTGRKLAGRMAVDERVAARDMLAESMPRATGLRSVCPPVSFNRAKSSSSPEDGEGRLVQLAVCPIGCRCRPLGRYHRCHADLARQSCWSVGTSANMM